MSHINESCHIWIGHINELCHIVPPLESRFIHVTYESVMSHMNGSCYWVVSHMNWSCQWVVSHINESCQGVMSHSASPRITYQSGHIWMTHVIFHRCNCQIWGSFNPPQSGKDPWNALSLKVVCRKRALYLVTFLRKMTCNLRHPVGLRHSVLPVYIWQMTDESMPLNREWLCLYAYMANGSRRVIHSICHLATSHLLSMANDSSTHTYNTHTTHTSICHLATSHLIYDMAVHTR